MFAPSLNTLIVLFSMLVPFNVQAITGCYLSTPARDGTGLFGCKHYDDTFDDRNLVPELPAEMIQINCRTGVRLDFLEMIYLNRQGDVLGRIRHGNVWGGTTESNRALNNYDKITSLQVFLCTETKSAGKVCGILFKFANDFPFSCGHTNTGGQGEYVFARERKAFHSFRGTTVSNNKVINSIGWNVVNE